MKKTIKTHVKCPICEGRGIVPGGFYHSLGDTWASSEVAEKCRQCGGMGLLYAEIIEDDSDEP